MFFKTMNDGIDVKKTFIIYSETFLIELSITKHN